jgi:hypothetical protein
MQIILATKNPTTMGKRKFPGASLPAGAGKRIDFFGSFVSRIQKEQICFN